MIAIIDYDAGNVKSVQKALAYLHEDTILTRDRNTACSRKSHPSGCWGIRGCDGKIKRIWSD